MGFTVNPYSEFNTGRPDVELFRSGPTAVANTNDLITIRVRGETATMTLGEWTRLVSQPICGPVILAQYPGGIDDMGLG